MTLPRYMSRSVLNFQCAIRMKASGVVSWEIVANETSIVGRIATDLSRRCKNYLDLAELWPVESSNNNIFVENVIQHVALEEIQSSSLKPPSALKSGGVGVDP